MSWVDWIPVVSTIKHAFYDDPKGRAVEDYAAKGVTPEECGESIEDRRAARLACEKRMQSLAMSYLLALLGDGAPSDLAEGAVGLSVIARWLGKKAAARAPAAATGVGAVLLIDGAIDAAITIKRAREIYDAYIAALDRYCECPRP